MARATAREMEEEMRRVASIGGAAVLALAVGAVPAGADPLNHGFQFTLTCDGVEHHVVANGANNAPVIHDLGSNTMWVPFFAQDEYADVYDSSGTFVRRNNSEYPDGADKFVFRPGNGNGRDIQLCQYAFQPATFDIPDDDPDLGVLTFYRFGTLGVTSTR